MKIIISESQYNQIIFESSFEQFKSVFTGNTQISLPTELPKDFQQIQLPKITSPDLLFTELGNKGFKISNFEKTGNPSIPLQLTGNFKGNDYKLSFQPFNRGSNDIRIKLTITLSGLNKKPKIPVR